MKASERFQAIMAGRPADRAPLLDEGIREEVVEAWKQQGLTPQRALTDCFHER